jgi:hypothetical protein
MPADTTPTYRIWGPNHQAEQPIELPALVSAIKAQKVRSDSWVYLDQDAAWRKASEVTELKMFFKGAKPAAASAGSPPIKTGVLRRIKVFAEMDEDQLQVFVGYMEIVNVRQFTHVVRKGEHGDAMYLVLEGELRAVAVIDAKESTLSTIGVGESFGEISVLDQGPRSADVVANVDSTLLKIPAKNLDRLLREVPQAAGPFLFALSKSVAGRLRHLTKRYEDSIQLSRAAREMS